jgi:hypothetical protein
MFKKYRDEKYEIFRNPWKDLPSHKVILYILLIRVMRRFAPEIYRIKRIIKEYIKGKPLLYRIATKVMKRKF